MPQAKKGPHFRKDDSSLPVYLSLLVYDFKPPPPPTPPIYYFRNLRTQVLPKKAVAYSCIKSLKSRCGTEQLFWSATVSKNPGTELDSAPEGIYVDNFRFFIPA